MLNHLENNDLIPDEQKSNRRKLKGSKELILVDKMILQNAKRRKTK